MDSKVCPSRGVRRWRAVGNHSPTGRFRIIARPQRHRCGTCSMAACRFPPLDVARTIAPDTLVDFHTVATGSRTKASRRVPSCTRLRRRRQWRCGSRSCLGLWVEHRHARSRPHKLLQYFKCTGVRGTGPRRLRRHDTRVVKTLTSARSTNSPCSSTPTMRER